MKYKIIVVDDSQTMLSKVKSILSKYDEFDVEYFIYARDAFHQIIMLKRQNINVDVVLTDIMLKEDDISGTELLREIVMLKFYIGVIVMSSYLETIDFYELIFNGADDFLDKNKPKHFEKTLAHKFKNLADIIRDRNLFLQSSWKNIKRIKRDVFVSHSTKDMQIARGINKLINIHNYKINTWLADLDLVPGDPWEKEVKNALKSTKCFIVILTENAIKSQFVMDELDFSLKRKQKEKDSYLFIPILYELDYPRIPKRIKSLNYVDLSKKSKRVQNFDYLMDRINSFLRIP
jgi:DNA-binding NarL/FixJ family response regulator